MSSLSVTHADGSRETVEDHGDGTATRTTYDPVGAVLSTETIDVPLPDPPSPEAIAAEALTALVATLGAEGVARSAVLGAHLAGRAGDLWDALDAIDPGPTRDAVEVVTDAALTAATTPLETP